MNDGPRVPRQLQTCQHCGRTDESVCGTTASFGHCVHYNDNPKKEMISHPQHYGGDTVYETIKVIDAWGLNFNLGNCVKYISRAGKKESLLEDLRKARWYLDHEIFKLEKKP